MKQTNHAITFLNASYQAVFKHAYVAGLASSVALLAASPYALANPINEGFADKVENGFSKDVNVTKSGDHVSSEKPLYANNITFKNENESGGADSWEFCFKTPITSGTRSDAEVYFNGTLAAYNATINISGTETASSSLIGQFENTTSTSQITFNDSKLIISHGNVQANYASFSGGSIRIGGKQEGTDESGAHTYMNYSTLKTGIGGTIPITNTTTSLNGTNVDLLDNSAIDVNGKLTFENGVITINATHSPGLLTKYGEISAKGIIRADQFDLNNNSSIKVENDTNNAYGGIFANEFKLNNGSINVASGSNLQLAGKITNPMITTQLGFHRTFFSSGSLNINSSNVTIENSGNLTLGAISTDVEGYWGKTITLIPTQYNVTQGAGSLTNYGTLNLGETPTDVSKFSGSDGTLYTLNSGSFISSGSESILNLNQNAKFIVNNGEFTSHGEININKNASLDIQGGSVTFSGGSSAMKIEDGGVFSIVGSAIQDPVEFYSPADGKNINVASVDQLGTINLLSGGSIELKDGVFGALTLTKDSDKLSEKLNQLLTKGSVAPSGTILFKDATLLTNVNLDNFSSDFLEKQTNISGSGDAALITTGNINFTLKTAQNMGSGSNSGSIGSLAGFSKIQGQNVTIVGTDPGEKVYINSLTKKTIAATNSLTTSGGKPLAINNGATLELSSDLVSLNETSVNNLKIVQVNLEVNSGGNLNVLAGNWSAPELKSIYGSTITISGSTPAQSTTAQDQEVVTQLSATTLNLNGAVNVSGNASLKATETLILGKNSATVVSDQSSISAFNLDLNGKLTLINSSADIKSNFTVSGGSVTANNASIAGLVNFSLNSSSLALDSATAKVTNEFDVSSGSVTAKNGSTLDLTLLSLADGSTFSLDDASKLIVTNTITTSGSGNTININGTDVELTAKDVVLSAGSTISATSGSSISLNTLRASGTSTLSATESSPQVTIDGSGSSLTINGDKDNSTLDLTVNLTLKNDAKLDLGQAIDTIGLQTNADGTFNLNSAYQKITANQATVVIDLANPTAETVRTNDAIIDTLRKMLFTSDDYQNIHLYLENTIDTDIDDPTVDADGNKFITFDQAKDSVSGNVDKDYSTDTSRDTILKDVPTDTNRTISGGWRAVQTSSGSAAGVNVDGRTLAIYGNYNGNLVSNTANQAVGVNLTDDAKLILAAKGKIGEITGSGSIDIEENAEINVVETDGNTATKIAGKTLNNKGILNAAQIDISDTLNNYGTLNATGTIDVTTANLYDNSVLNAADFTATSLNGYKAEIKATNITVTNANLSGSTVQTNTFTVNSGDLTATANALINVEDILTINSGNVFVYGDASLNANKLLITGGNIEVGRESSNVSGTTTVGSTGKLVVDQLDLNGNYLILDPDFGQKTATAFIKSFADLDNSDEATASDIFAFNGNIIVGRNSALGLGGERADFEQALAAHQDENQSLKENSIGALAFVNQANIALNGYKLIIGTESISELKEIAASGDNTIYIGQNSGLQIGTKAMSQVKAQNDLTVFSDLDSADTIASASGSTLIVPADTTDEDISKIFGVEVNLADGSIIQVKTENGAFFGTIDSEEDLHGTGDFVLTKSPTLRQVLNKMSAPTFAFFDKNYSNLSTAASRTSEEDIVNRNTAYEYIVAAGSNGDGLALEQAARFGGLGVGVQVASQVNKASTDAILQRMSMETDRRDPNMNVAENGRAAMWVSSIYQNFNADGFQADDLKYGADIDLYGIAAGFDFAPAQGFKVGAMFNVGKGDASGTDVGAGVSNEFKYYGAGLYASFNPSDTIKLTADVTYTKVDNDLSANAGIEDFGKLASTMDSTALSAGLTAEYTFKAGGVNISPYAGVRYTRLDLDSYNVAVDGVNIATTNTDAANVFSIPVGFTISSTIVNNDWMIQPSLDINLTSNFGDKNLKSTTVFDQQNDAINYSTEFMDSFSYGAKAGIQIKNGNFSLGANVGYTKSSNTDELAVGANARFVF